MMLVRGSNPTSGAIFLFFFNVLWFFCSFSLLYHEFPGAMGPAAIGLLHKAASKFSSSINNKTFLNPFGFHVFIFVVQLNISFVVFLHIQIQMILYTFCQLQLFLFLLLFMHSLYQHLHLQLYKFEVVGLNFCIFLS
jgi:hypothetical protein